MVRFLLRAAALAGLVVWTSGGGCTVRVSSGHDCAKHSHPDDDCDGKGTGEPPPPVPSSTGSELSGYRCVPAGAPLAHPTARLLVGSVRDAVRASSRRDAFRVSSDALAADRRLRLPPWAGVLVPGGVTRDADGLRVTWHQRRAPLARLALPPGRVVFQFDREGRLLEVDNATWVAP